MCGSIDCSIDRSIACGCCGPDLEVSIACIRFWVCDPVLNLAA
jgi:hypothetical protein